MIIRITERVEKLYIKIINSIKEIHKEKVVIKLVFIETHFNELNCFVNDNKS